MKDPYKTMKKSLCFGRTLQFFSLLALMFVAINSQCEAAVIYLNNFGNNTAGALPVNNANIGWNLLRSQNGGNVADASGNTDARAQVNQAPGKPSDAANVNAPSSLSLANGVVGFSNGSGATAIYTGLFYTSQYLVNRSLWNIDTFQWYAQASAVGTTQRLAVEVGGNWYVSAPSSITALGSYGQFANSGATGGQLLSLDFATATWSSLNFTLNSTAFSIGSTTTLPAGNLDAFGLYMDLGSTTNIISRFDTFTINATSVPEPATMGLVGIATLLLLRRKSRLA